VFLESLNLESKKQLCVIDEIFNSKNKVVVPILSESDIFLFFEVIFVAPVLVLVVEGSLGNKLSSEFIDEMWFLIEED
jgi:hypothetical protein